MSRRMMNRFMKERMAGNKLFVPFISAGDRGLDFTRQALLKLAAVGADAIELGVPFSDPLVDGKAIQHSFQRALALGVNLPQILKMVHEVRSQLNIPIILMGSLNLFMQPNLAHTAASASQAGVDGFIIPDFPPEVAGEWIGLCQSRDMDTIFLTTPNSSLPRLQAVARASTGYVYYVSAAGTTGVRQQLPKGLEAGIARVRQQTPLPILVGFGVSTPDQARQAVRVADGVIVGSALIQATEKGTHRQALQNLGQLAQAMIKNIKKQ